LRISANAAIGRREYVTARRFGETLLQRGLDERDVVLITEGHYLIGVTSFWLGDLHTSRRSLQLALESHQARHIAVHLERFGQDPRAVCLVRLGLTSFQLADEATAAESCARALERAAELGHEYTDVYVRMFAAWYLSDSGQADAAADVVNGMPATTQNPVAPIARAQFSGWAHTQRGDAVTGVRLLCQAQHAAHHDGPLMFEPYALMLLARSRLAAGEPSAAHRDATSALGIATSEMPYHVPEASRLVAEIEMQTDADAGRALDRLELAADAAAGSGAVIHELRARTSLLRAARLHAPASVAQHARTLQACCDALPPASDLCDLAAARRELAGGR